METALPCPWCDAPLGDADQCPSCKREPIVCEHFRVIEVLGRGGMGIVYGAERVGPPTNKQFPESVAVKIIAPPTNEDWTAWELFERSSRVLQQLHHARLPKVYAFERTDRGRLVLVREAFEGGTLEERIAESDDRIEPNRVRALLGEMLSLLEYLQGLVPPVIHRDIKPSNVMFRTAEDWHPVLVDFDTVVSRRSGLTIVGTPGYAAPEQFAADASTASDVYGLGATMLFVATHTDADSLPHAHGKFVLDGLMPSLEPELVNVLARMVEPDVSKRFANAHDVKLALKEHHAHAPEPVKPRPAETQSPKRWPWLVGLVGALLTGAYVCEQHHATKATHGEGKAAEELSPENAESERACTAGSGSACFDLALRYDDGTDGLTQDYARAAALYDRGCKLGHETCCNNLGVDYQHGYGVDADVPKAASLYQSACDSKNALGCRNLALLYEDDGGAGVPHDIAKTFAMFTRGCDLEDGRSCNDLGWMVEDGQGTKVDLKKAASLYALACDHGYLYGCRNSGIAYQTADGVERDDRRALALFRRACVDSEKSGCIELGRMTRDGLGVAADPARAADAFQKACDGNFLVGCEELARLYASGKGVAKDRVKAKKLYERACDAGVEGSCSELRALPP